MIIDRLLDDNDLTFQFDVTCDIVDRIDESIDRYELQKQIAVGGMGAVYLVDDQHLNRKIVVKFLQQRFLDNPDAIARFIQEAKITSKLQHPNIVPIHKIGKTEDGDLFYTMPYIEGETLKFILDELESENESVLKRYTPSSLLNIFIQLCQTVEYAHEHGILHRDIKPENIMIGEFGNVYLMDWGIGKLVEGDRLEVNDFQDISELRSTSNMTMTGQMLGTPGYMAPEQIKSGSEITNSTDVFALGAVLYHIVNLKMPFRGITNLQTITNTIQGKFSSKLNKINREDEVPFWKEQVLSVALRAIYTKALNVNINSRYHSANELRVDVERYMNGYPTKAEDASFYRSVSLMLTRHKFKSFFFLTSITLIVIISGLTLYSVNKSKDRVLRHKQVAVKNLNDAFFEKGKREKRYRNLQNNQSLLFSAAKKYIHQGDDVKAEQLLRSSIQLKKNSTHFELLGDIYQSRDRFNESSSYYVQAQELAPSQSVENKILDNQRYASYEFPYVRWGNMSMDYKNTGREAEAEIINLRMGKFAKEKIDELAAILSKTSPKTTVDLNTTGISVSHKGEADITDLSCISGFPVNELDWKSNSLLSLEGIEGISLINCLILGGQYNDVSSFRNCRLTFLRCVNNMNIVDLEPLNGQPINRLYLGSTGVEDIATLASMPLVVVMLENTNVSDITPLKGKRLKWLELHGLSGVRSIDILAGMPLRSLGIAKTGVSDLSPLKGAPLYEIDISYTKVNNINVLEHKPLVGVSIRETGVVDLSPLQYSPISHLDIRDTKVNRLDILKNFNLKKLRMSGIELKNTNFSFLKKSKRLKYLNANNLSVIDTDVFKQLKNLSEVYLIGCTFDDLTGFRMISPKILNLSASNIQSVDLLDTPTSVRRLFIKDVKTGVSLRGIEKYSKLQILGINGTAILDTSALLESNIKTLQLSTNQVKEHETVIRSMPKLEKIKVDNNKPLPVDDFWVKWDELKAVE